MKPAFNAATLLVLVLTVAWPAATASAQEWTEPVRGSWLRAGDAGAGDLVLAEANRPAVIVVSDDAHSAVRQAARFLAGDLQKLTGADPAVSDAAPRDGRVSIRLVTLGDGQDLPQGIRRDELEGQWEAYQVLTTGDAVWLVGSNPRGTAFAVYTLSERLGIDPLYLWSGYRPRRHERLVMQKTDSFFGPPTVKYRGLFHDDEDILPRPFERSGYPLRIGDVPLEWYERFFETALRLRMNMVAPYTRVHRRFEVQKTASDWGLFYTSHHYDILLSNPYGYQRFNLAEKRGVSGDWNWQTNSDGMLKFWRGGVEENGRLDAIWPVGLRGTEDYAYPFPEDMPEAEQNRIFQEVITRQIEITREAVPEDKRPPVFHFTLYGEMLDKYLDPTGGFEMPEDVVLIWCDDNDGRMRALPTDDNRGKWKHGTYYHMAYWGPVHKQTMMVVPPVRIAGEFKRIVASGATEFMLLNVSELREFVLGTRMIAEICWDAETALADTTVTPMPDYVLPHTPRDAKVAIPADAPAPSGERFIKWWAREYFGDAAAEAAEAYRLYYELIDRWDMQWYANDRVPDAINSLVKKFAGEEFAAARAETVEMLTGRQARYRQAFAVLDRASARMDDAQRQFFFENCELPLRITGRHTEAAVLLLQAMAEPDRDKAWALCQEAMKPLEQLEVEILRAERPPFEGWYRPTYIRHHHSGLNPHRAYLSLRAFLSSGGTGRLHLPTPDALRPDVGQFLPLLMDDKGETQ